MVGCPSILAPGACQGFTKSARRIGSSPEHRGGHACMKRDCYGDRSRPVLASHPHQAAPSNAAGRVSSFRCSTPASRRLSMTAMIWTGSAPLSAFSQTCGAPSPVKLSAKAFRGWPARPGGWRRRIARCGHGSCRGTDRPGLIPRARRRTARRHVGAARCEPGPISER